MGPNVLTTHSFQVLDIQLCSVLVLPKQCLHWLSPCCSSQPGPGERLSIRWVRRHQCLLPEEQIHSAVRQAGSRSSTRIHIRFHCRTVTGLSYSPQRAPAASSERPVSFPAIFARLGTAWDVLACAAVITERYVHTTKHSFCCLGWSSRELSATSSTDNRGSIKISCLLLLVPTDC